MSKCLIYQKNILKLDGMAKDEEKNRLNIYDFFESTHEIIYEDIKSTLILLFK